MITTISHLINFVANNFVWIIFAAIVLWITIAPQLNRFFNRERKSTDRFFVE